MGIEEGELVRGLGYWREARTEEGDDDVAWQTGPTCRRGGEDRQRTGSEIIAGLRAACGTRPDSPPWPLFLYFSSFLLFLFCFLIPFITFAFVTQMTSNQFVKFSKIPINIPEQ
jgi:hypothetical protein